MKLFLKSLAIFCGVLAFSLIGQIASAAPPKQSAAPLPQPQPTVKAASEPAPLSGKVVETMSAGGYSYICLEKKGEKTWVAVPEIKVTVGQEMTFQPGSVMTNFNSKSLNRTFERIIFSKGPLVQEGTAAAAEKKAVENQGAVSGKVVETMNAGGYSYICLEKKGEKTWIAVPEMKATLGREMTFQPGQAMKNFTSKTLGKTFDSIIFSGGPAAQQAGPGKSGGKNVSGSKVAASPLDKDIKVEKAAGPDAYTVAEIYEKRASLHKKTAEVRGKVVKVSEGIMNKNWIHLQDGTGDPKKGSHNLVVTSQDLPAVGDVITVKGTVYKNKDFGSGYKYNVIIEKANIQR